MKTIWKFVLYGRGTPEQIPMPRDARIIHVAEQHGVPAIWAEVDTISPFEDRLFCLVGTGLYDLPKPGWVYLGTCFIGSFVWHVYEVKEAA